MEWEYKNITISVCSDGIFYFNHKGKGDCANTLIDAKRKIDVLTEGYYNFTEKDISRMLKKLDEREKDFVTSLINELNRHSSNAYCEIGISDEMLFRF